ncbi:hypothetical protein VCR20J5_1240501 [Vibrio crassostreae]|nr:hypothetical protein VCR20J5_1240501 [Vibrio crassostreae]CDT32124.1 hypothetical protein VCR15J5_560004 [Vibrio crassostreae]
MIPTNRDTATLFGTAYTTLANEKDSTTLITKPQHMLWLCFYRVVSI